MALDRLTKIDGGGISTTSDYRVGIITASKFVGPFDGTGGNISGIITASGANFSGNVSIGGTLTYEDVTNIDSVGIITAAKDIHVGAGVSAIGVGTFSGLDISGDIDVDGHTNLDNVSVSGVTTFSNNIKVGTGVTIETNGNSNFVGVSSLGTGDTGAVYLYNPDADALSGTTNDIYGWKAKTYTSGLQVNSTLYLSRSGSNGLSLAYNNATGSYITANSGFLRLGVPYGGYFNLYSNDVYIKDRLETKTYAHFQKVSGTEYKVNLYGGNNVVKLTTEESGVNIVGTTTTTQLAVTGVSTFAGAIDLNADLDVDGHTNLDNVSVAGVSTFAGNVVIADSIVHDGDTNTKIRFPANDTISFETSGDERLRITSNGNVEIGSGSGTGYDFSLLDGVIINAANGDAGLMVNSSSSSHNAYISFSYGSGSGTSHADQFSAYIGRVGDDTLIFGTQNNLRWKIDSSGHLVPNTAGAVNIGSATAEIGDVYIADDKKLYVGSDQNISLYHTSSNSINHLVAHPGNLMYHSGTHYFTNAAQSQVYAQFIENNYCELRHSGNLKFRTSATGIDVTGEVATSQDYPNIRPLLDFNFAATKKLDSRLEYQRTGPASFTNEFGKVVLVGDNAPRFDHDPVTRESKGLLIEESRTNYAQYSTKINNDQGSYYNIINNAVLVSDAGVAPDGTNTATKMYPASSGSARGIEDIYSLPSTGEYTTSVYVKAAGHTGWIALYSVNGGTRAYFNPTTGVAGQPGTYSSTPAAGKYGIQDVGNGWYRCHLTINLTNTGGSEYFYIYFGDSDGSVTVTHSGQNGILMWGLQVEKGSFPTSYIPTQSDQVTRNRDDLTMLGSDLRDIFNDLEGTMYYEASVNDLTNDNQPIVAFRDQSNEVGNEIPMGFAIGGSNPSIRTWIRSAVTGSTANSFLTAHTSTGIVAGKPYKHMMAFKKDDFADSYNTGANSGQLTGSSGNMPTAGSIDELRFGGYYAFNSQPTTYGLDSGHIKRFSYWPQRLTNTQLTTYIS